MALYNVFRAVSLFLYVVEMCVFVYCITTWVAPRSGLRFWLEKFISPFCMPFQRLSYMIRSRWGSPFDFTCVFTLIGLSIADRLLWMLYRLLAGMMF